MVADLIEAAARETSQWREIRANEVALRELRDICVFMQGCDFAGKRLPITLSEESAERIRVLLTADLVRLRKQLTP